MSDRITELVLYYDSSVTDPEEDPETLRERIETIAANRDVEYEFVDVDGLGESAWAERGQRLKESVRPGREYALDGRVFTKGGFGRRRPVLAVHYADSDGVDVYPHLNQAVSSLPVEISDFLDELDPQTTSERSDRDQLTAASDDTTFQPAEREPTAVEKAIPDVPMPVRRRTVLRGLGAGVVVGGGAMVIGIKNLPVVGGLVDCGPGETQIGSITPESVGSMVEVAGRVDYALDDEAGITAFRLDGQTGTIPVYLAGGPAENVDIGDCLTIEGTVSSGETKSAEGPVITDAEIAG